MNYYEKQLQKEIDKFNNFVNNGLTKGIPEDLRNNELLLEYLTKGNLTFHYKGFSKGFYSQEIPNVKTIEELKEFTGENNIIELIDLMKCWNESVKLESYISRKKFFVSDIMDTLTSYDHIQLKKEDIKTILKALNKLNLFEILSLMTIMDIEIGIEGVCEDWFLFEILEMSRNGRINVPKIKITNENFLNNILN